MHDRPKLNRDWHLAHKMPKNPTAAQRVAWHLEHSRHCACRPMPDSIRALIAAGPARAGARTAPSKPPLRATSARG